MPVRSTDNRKTDITSVVDAPGVGSGTTPAAYESLIRALFQALNAADVAYVVPRNWIALPHSVGKDLDILIPSTQLRSAARLIRRTAQGLGYCSYARSTDGHGLEMSLFPVMSGSPGPVPPGVIDLDLRSFVSFNTCRIPLLGSTFKVLASQLNRRMVTADGCHIQVLTAIDEFICLYFQYLYKRELGIEHKVKQYGMRLECLLEDPAVENWVVGATGRADINALREVLLRSAEWHDSAWAMLRHRWGRPITPNQLFAQARAMAARVRFQRPILAPIVYFSGPDGSGKTTMTEGAMERLQAFDVPFRSLYSLKIVIRAFTKRLAFIKRLGRRKASEGADSMPDGPDLLFLTEDTRDRDTGTALWRFRKLVALLVGIVDIWIGWLLTFAMRCRGRIVLVETSPYDIFMKYHMPEFALAERILGPLLPKPSVGFLMKADPQNIHRRRTELTVGEIQEYYERFFKALDRCSARDRYVVVGTDADPDRSIAQTTAKILEAFP